AGATIETDARSSDFLKIKIGDTRYDILGGLQQNIVAAHRMIVGEKKSASTGNIEEFVGLVDLLTGNPQDKENQFGGSTGLSILLDFIQNKADPFIGVAGRALEGQNRA